VIYTGLISFGLTLIMVLSGVDMFGLGLWWFGLCSGVILGTIWFFFRQTGLLLGAAGLCLLALALFGHLALERESRAMFNGTALGFWLGLGISSALRWSHVKPRLLSLARLEEVRWLSFLLGDRT